MPQHNVARRLLRFGHESRAFKCTNDLLRPCTRQARKHTYAMMGVLTVMPSDIGFVLSVSLGM